MNIPTGIYASLSPSERIRAAVAAIARKDDAEMKTLTETCPRKTYTMMDAAFSDGMLKLIGLAIALESDLETLALDFLLAARLKIDSDFDDDILVAIASLEAAWGALLDEMGIDRADMAKAGPRRHPAVETLLSIAAGLDQPEIVEEIQAAMRDHLAT